MPGRRPTDLHGRRSSAAKTTRPVPGSRLREGAARRDASGKGQRPAHPWGDESARPDRSGLARHDRRPRAARRHRPGRARPQTARRAPRSWSRPRSGASRPLNPELNAVIHPLFDEAPRGRTRASCPEGPFTGVPLAAQGPRGPRSRASRFTSACGSLTDAGFHARRSTPPWPSASASAGFVTVGQDQHARARHPPDDRAALPTGPTRNPWRRRAEHPAGSSGGLRRPRWPPASYPSPTPTTAAARSGVPAASSWLWSASSRPRQRISDRARLWASSMCGLDAPSSRCRAPSATRAAVLEPSHGGRAPGDPYVAPPAARVPICDGGRVASPAALRVGLVTRRPALGVDARPGSRRGGARRGRPARRRSGIASPRSAPRASTESEPR